MTPTEYREFLARKQHRHHQLMDLVAEDWEHRRSDYWPTSDGVGPYDLKEPKQ